MWRTKRGEEVFPTSSNPEPVASSVRDLRPLPESLRPSNTQARIGKSLVFRGELKGSEDLYLDGEFEGNIELGDNNLVVGPQGRVRADIRAGEIVIEGTVQGNLRARDRLQIRKTGNVTGELVAARIVIEDGAYFKGSIDIERPQERPKRGEATSETLRIAAMPLAGDSKDKLQ
ncbi:MAG: polymer-forming cytoskeletal protein [Terriglobia bacterium]